MKISDDNQSHICFLPAMQKHMDDMDGAATLALIMLALVSFSAGALNRSRHAAEPWQQGP
jgi:uncharacterized phage-associated protein